MGAVEVGERVAGNKTQSFILRKEITCLGEDASGVYWPVRKAGLEVTPATLHRHREKEKEKLFLPSLSAEASLK